MLRHIPVLSDYDTGNGVCRYLVNNLCGIYENRPQICNIEGMYTSCFKDAMTENEFVAANMEACLKIAEYFRNESDKHKMVKAFHR
jgi:Fe-S-cluster containining protein